MLLNRLPTDCINDRFERSWKKENRTTLPDTTPYLYSTLTVIITGHWDTFAIKYWTTPNIDDTIDTG